MSSFCKTNYLFLITVARDEYSPWLSWLALTCHVFVTRSALLKLPVCLKLITDKLPAARVFYISLVFSNARRVWSQCNTRLRLLYLLKYRTAKRWDVYIKVSAKLSNNRCNWRGYLWRRFFKHSVSMSSLRARSFGLVRKKNIFRNIFRNGNPGIPEWE